MQHNRPIPVKQLHQGTFGHVICYPNYDAEELRKRLEELTKLGVTAIEFSGKKTVHNLPVLGKGCVGIVVIAYRKDERIAMKIRRTDSDRLNMDNEAEMLKKANTLNIGPTLLMASPNFLIMEFVKGVPLPEWINNLSESETASKIRQVLGAILEQSRTLDELGLDHGELHRAPRHIIIDAADKPWIVDFETASINRRVCNVTSVSHYLFMGSQVAKILQRKLGRISRTELIQALRNYKQEKTRKSFEKILTVCGCATL